MVMPVENVANFGNDGGLNQVIIVFQRQLWAVQQPAKQ
jgi:hypothetical protein